MTPTYINIFCFWVVQIPLAYFLALIFFGGGVGSVGVFWVLFVSDMLAGIVGVAVFMRGKWKDRVV